MKVKAIGDLEIKKIFNPENGLRYSYSLYNDATALFPSVTTMTVPNQIK